MFRFQIRAVRRRWGSVLVGLALLAGGAFPAVAAAAGAATPVCFGLAATIVGQPGEVTIRGTQGPDVIVALEPGVRVDGRGGDDTICTDTGDNIINGGAGNDRINGGDGDNTIDGGAGDDLLIGGSGNDILIGDTGNDTVYGGDGDNLASTGAGNDFIITGAGNDRIDGGKDFDTCQAGGGSNYVGHCEA